MASIVSDRNGTRRVLWLTEDGRRANMRLGRIDKRSAEIVAHHLQALVDAQAGDQPIPRPTAAWLKLIEPALLEKLARAGLVEGPKRSALGPFLERYILGRTDVKPATLEIWSQPVRNLVTHFGADRSLRTITAGDADRFREWLLTQSLAPTTVAKRLAFARSFFNAARRHRFIEENPFEGIHAPAADVRARQSFVDRETLERVMEVADPTWRTILALARLGGLRCPSEVLSLEWRHVDWKRQRITVVSPKTARYEGKASREIPLYPELEPYLRDAWELAGEGQTHVVGGRHLERADTPKGWRNVNLRTQLERLIARAGLTQWPRLFHNLRASRESELLRSHALHVVAAWQGHDVKVAVKHYAMVTDGDFEAATAASVLKNVLTERTDQYQPTSTNEAQHTPSPSSQTPSFLGDSGALCASLDSSGYSDQRRGWDSNTLENDRGFRGGVLNCVLTANDRLELAELIEAWLELDRPLRAPFLAMIRAGRTRSG